MATRKQRLAVSRELVKHYAKNEGLVVDELIKQRREAAKTDLRSIHDFIAHNSWHYAKKVIQGIREKTEIPDEL